MKQQREGTEQERLVGRKEEVRRVLDIVERVQSNVQRGAAVLVTGEAGIGKTEFADHLRRSLKLRGHAILECTCRPRDDRPNGVFIELFARGIQLVSDGGHSAEPLERALDVLSGMVPRAQRANGRPTSDAMFLRETVRRALAQVRAPGVPVVIIRDLHHADETTLNVIAYLFENLLTDPAFDWTSTDYASNPASMDTFRGVVLTTFRETARTQRLTEFFSAQIIGLFDQIEQLANVTWLQRGRVWGRAQQERPDEPALAHDRLGEAVIGIDISRAVPSNFSVEGIVVRVIGEIVPVRGKGRAALERDHLQPKAREFQVADDFSTEQGADVGTVRVGPAIVQRSTDGCPANPVILLHHQHLQTSPRQVAGGRQAVMA